MTTMFVTTTPSGEEQRILGADAVGGLYLDAEVINNILMASVSGAALTLARE